MIGSDYQYGDEGDDVTAIQTQLVKLGYLTVSPTGYYGTATRNAVRTFQQKNGLPVTGTVNETTLKKLFDSHAVKASGTAVPKITATPKKTKTPKPTNTPKPTKTPMHTATPDPNPYKLVTPAPNGKYVTLREGNMGIWSRSCRRR